MENLEIWLTPLLFLPGVALLVLSTSIRYGRIHNELHHLTEHSPAAGDAVAKLMHRAKLFCNALVSLYLSFGLFSLASLLGGLTKQWLEISRWLTTGLMCLGIASLVFAAYELARESILSFDIIQKHGQQLLDNE